MTKIYFLLFIIVLIIFSTNNSIAQPKFSFEVTAGYSQPMGDFNNGISLNDTVPEAWPYLMGVGYNIGVTGKYAVNKLRNIKIVLGLNYNGFKNWGDLNVTAASNNSADGYGSTETQTVEFLPKVAILVLSLGGEYSFNPKATVNPFAGIDFTTNFFSGSYQTNPTSNFPESQLKAETRFGFQAGGGVDIKFSNIIGGVIGAKYNFANLIGKGDNESDESSDKVYLNDSEQTYRSASNISYFQFYAGVSFYFENPLSASK